MVLSALRDNYSMAVSAGKLMKLYKEGLIPKAKQGFESALSGYVSGKVELITAIRSLTLLLDYEISYWSQFVEFKRASAKIEALTGGTW